MARRCFLLLIIIIVVASTASSGAAHAADPPKNPNTQQLAQSLFDEAKRLIKAGTFSQACPKLAESQRLDPSGGTLLHLGICHASEGKTASAYAELNEAISVARRDGRADRESVAKAHLVALTAKLVRLTIHVTPEARAAEGLVVTWNGTPLPEAQWGVAFPVDPGEQTIQASAPKRRPWSSHVDVALATNANARIEVPALMKEPEAAPIPPPVSTTAAAVTPREEDRPPIEPTRGGGGTQRVVGISLAAAGVIGLGIGGAFQLRALSLASERDDAANAGDAATTQSKHEDAKSSQLLAGIAGGIGLAAVVTGVILYFTAPSGGNSKKNNNNIIIRATANGFHATF